VLVHRALLLRLFAFVWFVVDSPFPLLLFVVAVFRCSCLRSFVVCCDVRLFTFFLRCLDLICSISCPFGYVVGCYFCFLDLR
jgi:hypothetical protein